MNIQRRPQTPIFRGSARVPTRRFFPIRAMSLIHDDRGAAMLEFVLIAPVLSYMIVAILFFRNHIDYAQDMVINARFSTWDKAVPNNATSATGADSDNGSFFTVPMRPAMLAAGVLGLDGSVGAVVAALSYNNGLNGVGTPYEALDLAINNYQDQHVTPLTMQEEPWGEILGNFGKFFGNSIGTGDHIDPDGLSVDGWEDRFPMVVNPWQRAYSDGLDAYNYGDFGIGISLASVILEALNVATILRTPVPRVDTRDDIDIGHVDMNFPPSYSKTNSDLQLTSVTSTSQIEDIVE